MNNNTERYIKILKNITKQDFNNPMGWSGYYDSELKELQQAIENILADRERLEKENKQQKQQLNDAFDRGFIHNSLVIDLKTKANKYDSLVEKLKEKISERSKRINKLHPASDCELIDDIEREINVLQELLDTEKEEI